MARREFTAKIKVAAFERADGRCEECTARLAAGNVEYDHRIPDALGGDPTLDNCVVLCRACHRTKTSGQDVPRIAKKNRQHAKHIGAKVKRPWHPTLRKKMNGEIVPR
jgi:5-methylcytosine-specific restriction enzyme A